MNHLRLFRRDCVYYRKPFATLFVTAGLVCAVLTSALLIGTSVRGTLFDCLHRNTGFVQTRVRFAVPIETKIPGGVLHVRGFIPPGVKADLYAFSNDERIQERDAYCSEALAETLGLTEGDPFTVNVQTVTAIPGDTALGKPPEVRQVRFVFRGVLPGEKAEANFENPQRRANNLFVNLDFLARSLTLEPGVINEVWLPDETAAPNLPDDLLWKLTQLSLDSWEGRVVLKSKAFFLPESVTELFPGVARGLTTFAESLSGEGVPSGLNYFFVGAFEGDVFPVETDHAILSETIGGSFPDGATLTFFVPDPFRGIERETCFLPKISMAPDLQVTAALTPEIPGLTDVSDCSGWNAAVPVEMDRITAEDKAYWERHKSKPKLYMNFAQAQRLFFPGRCNVLVFDPGTEAESVRRKIVESLRQGPGLFRTENVVETLSADIENGIPFAPLFLGLSSFIIVSSLLVLATLLRLHLFDRSEEFQILAMHVGADGKGDRFHLLELLAVLLPGMLLGLFFGILLCRFQLYLLEHVWNGIIRMNRLNFHARPADFFTAFFVTLLCSLAVLMISLRSRKTEHGYCYARSRPVRSISGLAGLSIIRRLREYRTCMVLLALGFLGTLGVGAFGIKNRGEDAFSHDYIAETTLPVTATHDEPFPPGAIPVRVYEADSADCSNILRANVPTVYGCDVRKLTGEPGFLDGFSAAADAGSMLWIMKKKIGDAIRYPRGTVTLARSMKASVFQRGILVDIATFEELFPEVRGARFFLIRDGESVEAWRKYLEPFGVTLVTTDAFMAEAESFQNRYLAIFLQLGLLGFVLGIGSLLLLMLRNLHARREEIVLLGDLGFSRNDLFLLYYLENVGLYLASAFFSLLLLAGLAFVAGLHFPTLIAGWSLLAAFGSTVIYVTLSRFFSSGSRRLAA